MAKTFAGIALIFIIGTLAYLMLHTTPQYFVCEGSKTNLKTNQVDHISDISMKLEIYPTLNRTIFSSENYGMLVLDSFSKLFWITDMNDVYLIAKSDNGHGIGRFDRISRHFTSANDNTGYDLSCHDVRPAA